MSLQNIKDVKKRTDAIIIENAGKIELANASDNMFWGDYELPKEIDAIDWMHTKISMDPHDHLRHGTRTLSAKVPHINIDPHLVDQPTKELNGRIETWLKHIMTSTNSRRKQSIIEDIVFSALSYDEVITYTDYLPYHHNEKDLEGRSKNEREWIEESIKENPFDIAIWHPAAAFVEYTKFGVQSVVTREVVTIAHVADEWGKRRTRALREASKEDQWCTLYNYVDRDYRYVWAVPQDEGHYISPPNAGNKVFKGPRKEPFMSWESVVGGTKVTATAQLARIPLLHSVILSGAWGDQCLMDSVEFSLVAAMAARPMLGVENASGEIYRIEYWNPFVIMKINPGDKIIPININPLDPALGIMSDKEARRMENSMMSRVSMGTMPGSDVPFSSYNLASQTSMKTLLVYRKLSEKAISKICKTALKWMRYMKDDIVVEGQETVKWNMIPVNPTITVQITEDKPTDHAQDVNTAVNAINNLGFSRARALMLIGEDDPATIEREAYVEKMRDVEIGAVMMARQNAATMLENMKNAGLGQLAQLAQAGVPQVMQLLQVANQLVTEAAQGAAAGSENGRGGEQARKPAGAQFPESPDKPSGMIGVEGETVNPAADGAIPERQAPGMGSREVTTGKTRREG